MLGRFVAFMLAGMAALPCHADISGEVVAIQDGDTLTVLDELNVQHRIRLTGIDAPEKRQSLGQKSKEALSDCAFGKQVFVEGDKFDRYQRLLGKVLVEGEDCNLKQIRLGMAWHYKKYERSQPPVDRVRYARMELAARQDKVGLWAEAQSVAPWDFRHP